jgi:GNAT superfamily N-acetyltransferase
LKSTHSPGLLARTTATIFRQLATAADAAADMRRASPAMARPQSSLCPFPPSPPVLPGDDAPRGREARPPAGEDTPIPMRITKASAAHLDVVLGLIEEARAWLGAKETKQWATPWPTREARDARVLAGLNNGKTWIVWDGDTPAATVTIATRANQAVWSKPACECDLAERAVYAHRLITARNYSGRGLGAELIDWAGLRGRREYGAKWVRIDVWNSNHALHGYYQERGFEPCGTCADPSYPSGALFQKPVSAIVEPSFPWFTEISASLESTSVGDLVGSVR